MSKKDLSLDEVASNIWYSISQDDDFISWQELVEKDPELAAEMRNIASTAVELREGRPDAPPAAVNREIDMRFKNAMIALDSST